MAPSISKENEMSAIIVKEPSKDISMKAMYVGQIGTFTYGSETVIALRTYDGLVNLNNPNHTWPLNVNGDLRVVVLPPGTIIQVEAL
jgi:hypothetical protein